MRRLSPRSFLRMVRALSVLGIGAACKPGPPQTAPFPDRDLGVYRFSERVPGTSVLLEGEFVVRSDSIVVDARPGPCRYDDQGSSSLVVIYRCGNMMLSFDRRNPVQRVQYSTVVRVTEARRICVRFVTDSRGRRTCAETRIENVERDVVRTGRLRPRAVQEEPPGEGGGGGGGR